MRAQSPKKDTCAESALSTPASVVDLFCGAGGLSHGFKGEGFAIEAGIDVDEACRFAFESNNGAPFIRRDISTLKPSDVERLFTPGRKRVLVGCAPCQPFSVYNQKNSDPKWRLVNSFAKLIEAVLPDIVSMENVPRLLQFKGGRTFAGFVRLLEKNGYHVAWGTLYGPDFGLAQNRTRLVLLASRLGEIALPQKSHKGNYRTVADEIGHLPSIKHGETSISDPLHCASRLSATNELRIRAAKPGGTWRDWDEALVTSCHKEESGRGYAAVYGRMEWKKPSPTITTQFYGFGNGRFGHPQQDRALSLREGALLQSFPQTYEFVPPGERVQFKLVGRLIGNAVPVRLARAIAQAVRVHIESR
jgi:DNA (cytosine-5)-methyltransferase 1